MSLSQRSIIPEIITRKFSGGKKKRLVIFQSTNPSFFQEYHEYPQTFIHRVRQANSCESRKPQAEVQICSANLLHTLHWWSRWNAFSSSTLNLELILTEVVKIGTPWPTCASDILSLGARHRCNRGWWRVRIRRGSLTFPFVESRGPPLPFRPQLLYIILYIHFSFFVERIEGTLLSGTRSSLTSSKLHECLDFTPNIWAGLWFAPSSS